MFRVGVLIGWWFWCETVVFDVVVRQDSCGFCWFGDFLVRVDFPAVLVFAFLVSSLVVLDWIW